MVYNIPLCNEELFLKKVKRIMKKCHNGEVVVLPMDTILVKDEDRKISYKCRQYEVRGEYKIEGWEFVAEITHKDSGNVIRCIKSDYSDTIAQRYGEKMSTCEHCGKRLFRRNTFIIRNLNTNELKQVGSSCVKEYTNGLSAELCANISSFFADIEDELMYRDEFRCSYSSNTYFDRISSLKLMYYIVKNQGYDKETTKQVFIETYREMDYKDIDALVNDGELLNVSNWLENKSNSNAYWCSCKTLYKSDEVEFRDYNYLLSMFSVYFKEQFESQKQKNDAKDINEYVGQVGDRITFTAHQVRYLFGKGKYSYYGPEVYLVELLDKEGHTYIWSTSSYINIGDIIKATIKEHKDYRGTKQTVITRGTILGNIKKQEA